MRTKFEIETFTISGVVSNFEDDANTETKGRGRKTPAQCSIDTDTPWVTGYF